MAWRHDGAQTDFDRRVIVCVVDGEVVGVAAHERSEDSQGRPIADVRYVMAIAVRDDCRRTGVARVLAKSVIAEMQREHVRTVYWLVHPRNAPSIAFARTVFPDADEKHPPEDKPYFSFALRL